MAIPGSIEELIGPERLALLRQSERVAYLRQAVLAPLDLTTVVPDAHPGDDVVVLVHGFFASAGVFRPLRARLQRDTRARVATFTHAPGARVRGIAKRLAGLVERIPQGTRVTVVGHSLGGIVARWYVQEMEGHQRVARTISLGSPFRGLAVLPVGVGADLHEQSALLRRLREGAPACPVPHTSIVAGRDIVVPGHETACLGSGDVVILPERGHNTLLFDHEVAGLVIDRVGRR
jgi:triacylglycerol lipase